MRCHSVQALWSSTPPAHHVVSVVATHNPPSLWTGSSSGDIILWKLPYYPPDLDRLARQDLRPIAVLCGHKASIADLVACRLEGIKEDKVSLTDALLVERDKPNPSEMIVSVCVEGWLCAWDCWTGWCRRRRKLPAWLGSPCKMTTMLGAQPYVALACGGYGIGRARNPETNEGDHDMRKLVDNARAMAWEKLGSSRKEGRVAVVIIDPSTLGVLQVVYDGIFGVGHVKALAALPDANGYHKLMVSDAVRSVQVLKVFLKHQGWSEAHDERMESTVSPTMAHSIAEHGETGRFVCFSPDSLYTLVISSTRWVILLTEDQTLVHGSTQRENNISTDGGWLGGFFLVHSGGATGESYCDRQMFLIWDARGGATLYCLQTTLSLAVACTVVYQLPTMSMDCECELSIIYHQIQGSLVCIASSCSSILTPNVWVRAWQLPKSFMELYPVILPEDSCIDISMKQAEPAMYGLRTYWDDKVLSHFPSDAVANVDKSEGSSHSSSGNEWVTSSMVLFDETATPSALVLGFRSGGIKLMAVRVTQQEGGRGRSCKEEKVGCTIWALNNHRGPILCLVEHSIPTKPASRSSAKRFLISGGMDCLTCVWDLNDGGQLLTALHHHTTPVRQIFLPPLGTCAPWSNCFITVGEDGCVALVSLETLQVERMFVGHPSEPSKLAWDGIRGYLSCLCVSDTMMSSGSDVLFIWDVKSGALERILRGAAAHSMYSNLVAVTHRSPATKGFTSSVASLLQGEGDSPSQSSKHRLDGGSSNGYDARNSELPWSVLGESSSNKVAGNLEKLSTRLSQALNQGTKAPQLPPELNDTGLGIPFESSDRNLFHKQPPIKAACPVAGVAALQFDLFTLMAPDLGRMGMSEKEAGQSKVQAASNHPIQGNEANGHEANGHLNRLTALDGVLPLDGVELELASSLGSAEGCLLRTSLAYLHLWGVDLDLDRCLEKEWRIMQPLSAGSTAGLAGDKGATTLLFPSQDSIFAMWSLSAEFCALRSLTLVATALRMTTLSRHTSNANSALAAFYTRELAEKFPAVKAPSLELYACFWQDPSEHVRMAARSLFHCAVSRAIPPVLCVKGSNDTSPEETDKENCGKFINTDCLLRLEGKLAIECTYEKATWPDSVSSSSEIVCWLESYEGQVWTAVVGGTNQDARAARIIVGAALAVYYPGLVRPELAPSVAPYLVKLVKAVVDRHSAVAAELLADGMESVWRHLISAEIPHFISDVLLLVECLSGGGGVSKSNLVSNAAMAMTIREALMGSLLPCLAMADVPMFLKIMQSQLLSASASSSVHMVALMTMIRIIRGAPRVVVFYLCQVMSIILRTMNTGKHCHQTAMAAVREMVRVYPMVALHQSSGKLAVGDAAGDVHSLAIHVYDLNSASMVRVLDASGPPGHPALLGNDSNGSAGGISALAFSEDGEGVGAFSQHGLMIRYWSLSGVWWEKISRVLPPLQCNKLVLVPPWSGFSPKSSRSSIMATISDTSETGSTNEGSKWRSHDDTNGVTKTSSVNIDLSFRLEWKPWKKVLLLHHGQELGVFQL